MSWLVLVLAASVFLIVYSYALYPALLVLCARGGRRVPVADEPGELPTVSVVVAAHNEEAVIEEKIRNTFALDYPRERLELLVGSDGSVDGTDAICARYPEVRFRRIEPRRGKANVLNTLVPLARGEIILFTDANTIIDRGAVGTIVRHFQDPSVGGVCGRLVLTSDRERLEDTERAYWGYETRIKELESACYATIGANGGIYAIRKESFVPIPADTIIDDFLISMNVLERGGRLVFEKGAVAWEEVSKSFRDEFWRKARIGAGNLQVMLRKRSFVAHVPFFVGFAYLSHKVLRWLIPFLLVSAWVCSLLLSGRQPYRAFFWCYTASVALGAAGMLGAVKHRLARALAYLYAFNFALLLGYLRYLTGAQRATWRRAKR